VPSQTLDNLTQLKEQLDAAERMLVRAEARLEQAEQAVVESRAALQRLGLDPDKDLDAQLHTLRQRAVDAAAKAEALLSELAKELA
jgi:uncharacterized protein involved in exopolysaccharide biosynthesis